LIAPQYEEETRAGLQASAANLITRAVRSDPDYSYARAFRAIIAYRNGDAKAAKRYLAEFEANDPSQDAQAIIEQQDLKANIALLEKIEDSGILPGSTTTTTTTSTASTPTPSTTTPSGD
jgi:hypothetical protein